MSSKISNWRRKYCEVVLVRSNVFDNFSVKTVSNVIICISYCTWLSFLSFGVFPFSSHLGFIEFIALEHLGVLSSALHIRSLVTFNVFLILRKKVPLILYSIHEKRFKTKVDIVEQQKNH